MGGGEHQGEIGVAHRRNGTLWLQGRTGLCVSNFGLRGHVRGIVTNARVYSDVHGRGFGSEVQHIIERKAWISDSTTSVLFV